MNSTNARHRLTGKGSTEGRDPREITFFQSEPRTMNHQDSSTPERFDVVSLIVDLPHLGLKKGNVGIVVDFLTQGNLLVEFAGEEDRAACFVQLMQSLLIVLR